jgi:hypothetical protein
MALILPLAVSAQAVLPDAIPLPPGWQPEGIAKGTGTTILSGSIASGDVLAVDVLTGDSRLPIDAPFGRTASGLEQDGGGRLWVAGGTTGRANVYALDGAAGGPRSRSARRHLRQQRGDDRRRRGSPTRSMTSRTRSRSTATDLWAAGGGALTRRYQNAAGFDLNEIDVTAGTAR